MDVMTFTFNLLGQDYIFKAGEANREVLCSLATALKMKFDSGQIEVLKCQFCDLSFLAGIDKTYKKIRRHLHDCMNKWQARTMELEQQDDRNQAHQQEQAPELGLDIEFHSLHQLLNVENNIPLHVADEIVRKVFNIVNINMAQIRAQVVQGLESPAARLQAGATLQKLAIQQRQTMSEFSTQHKRNKALRGRLPASVPKILQVTSSNNEVHDVQYFPLKDYLLKLLTREHTRRMIVVDKGPSDPSKIGQPLQPGVVLRTFSDGNLYHSLGINGPTIFIRIYSDGVTLGNPVAGAKSQRKVLPFYVSPFTDYRMCSRRKNMHMPVCLLEATIKECSYAEIFRPMVQEYQSLQRTGLYADGIRYQIRFWCLMGDNLELARGCGMVESFARGQGCRRCYISKEQLNQATCYKHIDGEDKATTRRRTLYEYLRDAQCAAEDEGPFRGVKRVSIFSCIEYFDITRQTGSCFSHDALEGVVKTWIKKIFSYFTDNKKYATYLGLTEAVNKFVYRNQDKSNAPYIDPKTKKISSTFAQMLTLARLAPVIITEKFDVPSTDPYFKWLVEIQRMVLFLHCHEYDVSALDAMEVAIKNCLTSLLEISKIQDDNSRDPTITFKCHFLTHYRMLVEELGPMIFQDTSCFEGRHQYMKRIYKASKNSKNVEVTVGQRMGNLQAIELESLLNNPETSEIEFSKLHPMRTAAAGHRLKVISTEDYNRLVRMVTAKGWLERHIMLSQSVEVHGTRYSTGMFVVTRKTDDSGYAEFGKIVAVLSKKGSSPYLYLHCHAGHFWSSRGFYVLLRKPMKTCCAVIGIDSLEDYVPLTAYLIRDKTTKARFPVVALHHYIFNLSEKN